MSQPTSDIRNPKSALTPTIAEKIAALRGEREAFEWDVDAQLSPRDSRFGRRKPKAPEIGRPHVPSYDELAERDGRPE